MRSRRSNYLTGALLVAIAMPGSGGAQTAPAAPSPAPAAPPQQARPADQAERCERFAEDVGLPLRPGRHVRFTTSEGTWMSVDVSPDGRTIVFDHLGDLFTMPIAGGRARRLTGGMAIDFEPRFSPDGRRIVFLSDRSGGEAIWTIGADGTGARRVSPSSSGPTSQFANPSWSADGQSILVTRNTGYGGGKLLRYALADGSEETLFQAEGGPEGRNIYGPMASPDGRSVYFSYERRAAGLGSMLPFGHYQAARLDLTTRQVQRLAITLGGALHPVPSPDGRSIAYATRQLDQTTALGLHRLDSNGSDRVIARRTQLDAQEFYNINGLMPNFGFAENGAAIVHSHDGKIWRTNVETGVETEIPFQVDVDLELGPLSSFQHVIRDDAVDVRGPVAPRVSPDGQSIAFISAGSLWLARRDAPARRLTPAGMYASDPTWTVDGGGIAFVSRDRNRGVGHIFSVAAGGNAQPVQLTREEGRYDELVASPDGSQFFFRIIDWPPAIFVDANVDGIGDRSIGSLGSMPAAGGSVTRITAIPTGPGFYGSDSQPWPLNGQLHFAGNDGRLFYYPNGQLGGRMQSMRPDGSDMRTEGPPNGTIRVSPRGNRAVWITNDEVSLTNFPIPVGEGGARPSLKLALPPLRDLAWDPSGRTLYGFLGMQVFAYDVARFEREGARYRPASWTLSVNLPASHAEGSILLRGARIVTMAGDQVIESGDLLVRDGRIAALGPVGTLAAAGDTRIVDVSGKTIIPGLVDIHAHINNTFSERNRAAHMVALANGVTTIRDPSPRDFFSNEGYEIATGIQRGPRVFTTAPPMPSLTIACNSRTRGIVQRNGEIWRTETLKQYTSGNRWVRQQIVMAARQHGLTPTNEGVDFATNLSMVVDGYAGIEHFLRATPLADDMVQLLARAGTVLTPTLYISGDFSEESYLNFLLSRIDFRNEERQRRFVPLQFQRLRSLDRLRIRPESHYYAPRIARDLARIVAAGGRVGLGSHGELQGMGPHLELQTIASGGMPAHDALRVATIFGAEAIGHGRDLGSIEPGKLADLVVLDRNPLEDIRNTQSTRYVMQGGFLYDAMTLDEIWPHASALPRQWWQNEEGE